MNNLRLSWVVPLGFVATSGCGWVDSSGRQENRSPGLTELTQLVIENRENESLGLVDEDGNLSSLDYSLLAQGGVELNDACIAFGGALADVSAADFEASCDLSIEEGGEGACEILLLEPELLSSELFVSETPALRRPRAQQYLVSLQDTDGAASQQLLTLCIASESSAPVAQDDEYDVEYNAERVVQGVGFDSHCNMIIETDVPGEFIPGISGVLGNDSDDFDFSEDDANGQQCLVAQLVEGKGPEYHQGVFTLQADGGFVYSAGTALNVGESDSFSYTVSDGVNVSNEVTVDIRITGENSTPTSRSPVLDIDEDTELVLVADDLAEDEEAGELLLKNAVEPFPAMGVLEKLSGPERLRYTPNANESGTDSFGYRVEDAGGAFVNVTVDVTVNAVNDAPTIVADDGTDVALAVVGDTESLSFTVADVEDDASGNGIAVSAISDNTDVVSVSVLAGADAGSRQVEFTAVADGVATVTVTATDNDATSNTVPMTVDVVVGSGNQVPTVESPSPVLTTAMGDDLSINILSDAIADDPDGSNLGLEIVNIEAEVGGSVALVGTQQVTFTPSSEGTASFDLTVEDEDGAVATGTVVVEVTAAAVTQAPVIGSPTLTATNGVAETWNISADGLATDPDTALGDLVFTGAPISGEGTVAVSGDNKSITFTPSAAGPATITVEVVDPEGNSVSGDLSVTVGAANVAPTVAATTLDVVDGIPAEFELVVDVAITDSDGSAATVVVDGFANESSVTVASVAGNDQGFSVIGSGAGTGSFDLIVQDTGGAEGQGVMTVNISTNQSPTASNLALAAGAVDSLLTVSKADLGVGDQDSDAANVELENLNIVSVPATSSVTSAALSLGAAGADFSFTPDESGDYQISFDVVDEVNVESFSVTITVP